MKELIPIPFDGLERLRREKKEEWAINLFR
jgi:hypothetical protein